ncbi:PAS domain-containing sensor histidine kinase [Methanogenium sp. S4BF]|uniref:PAS domain-containing sensor histidine kinase n=1 Tax=Methanogenium sp. S4BF TaxID=1789226 RepID=UPI002416E614|nr:PAS domain-containing sensor histidine kinase [Methanogenium sp. S4BF]WFN34249.1 PAS domain-containing sensor histidine kinase [Methanogenium sp. S4BF]
MEPEYSGQITGGETIPVAGFSCEGSLIFSNRAYRKIAGTGEETDVPAGLAAGDREEFLSAVRKACSGTACSLQAELAPSGIRTRFSLFSSSDKYGPFALAVAVPDSFDDGAGAPVTLTSNLPFPAGDEAVLIADVDRRILDVNELACQWLGYTRKEMLRLGIDDIVAPVCRESTPGLHACLLEKGGGLFENLHVTRDGRVFPVEVHAMVIDYRGKPALLSLSRPITEIRRTECASDALSEMEKKYRSFFEAASEGFIVTDCDGVVLDINERFAALLDQPKRLVMGHSLFSFLAVEGAYEPESLIRSAIENGSVRFEAGVISGTSGGLALECCPITLQGEQCIQVIAREIPSVGRSPEDEFSPSSSLYLSAFDVSGTGLMIIDRNDRVVHANPEVERILGASADEMRGQPWADFVEDSVDPAIAEDADVSEGDGAFRIKNHEITFRNINGSEIPAVISVRDIPGTSLYIASVQDISLQREMIGALSSHREMFEKLFSSGCEAFILLDDTYEIRMWNTAAEEMFGYGADEVMGRNIFPLLFSRGPEEGQRIFQRFLEPDATSSGCTPAELSLSTKEGGAVHTEASVSRFTHQGHPYFLLIIRDNTERYRFIESLTESEEFLRFAIDAARVGIWDYDIEEDFFTMSEDVYAMLSLNRQHSSASRVSSDVWRTILHPDDLLTAESISLALMSGSITDFESEQRLRTAGGTWNWFALEGKVVEYDTTGRPQRVVGIIRDIQDKKQAESAIREANRKLSLLAGITRHDILNQIQGLLFYSEEMKTGEYTVDEMVVMAGKIYEMTETINRQIVLTRNYDMLGTEPPVWQNIHYLADEIITGMDTMGLVYRNESPMVEVYADYLFADVLRTVFENASRHAEGATTLNVRFAESDNGGVLTIEDNGCGIPLKYKEKIFSHGFSKGTGGRLFIAREIAGVTGIELYEDGEAGSGARFALRIPKSGYRFVGTEERDEL